MRIRFLFALAVGSACGVACSEPTTEEDTQVASTVDPIVGGEDAPRGVMPWMAALYYPADWYDSDAPIDRHGCGGTLIDAERGIVLTAAHCVGLEIESREGCGQDDNPCGPGEEPIWIPAAFPTEFVKVSIGSYALSEVRESDLLTVTTIILHPEYDDFIIENDLALLIVEGVDPSTPTPRLIGDRVWDPLLTLPGARARLAGWGLTDDVANVSPDNLQWATLPIIAPALCRHLVEDEFLEQVFTDKMMCAAPLAGGRGACFGDSGGGLTVRDFDGRRVVVGVTSWTPNGECARPYQPAVFANVLALRPWLTACLASPSTCPRAIEIPEDQING